MKGIRFFLSIGAVLMLALISPNASFQPVQAAPDFGSLFAVPNGLATSACSINDPCSLDQALAQAVDGTTIFLGEGTFLSTHQYNMIDLSKSVNLYGGWYNKVYVPPLLLPVLDPINHPTTLNGNYGRRAVYLHGGAVSNINGIKFTYGNARLAQNDLCGAVNAYGCGGAIFIYQATAAISDCYFSLNTAALDLPTTDEGYGGAIFVESPSGAVSIHDNTFEYNSATGEYYGDGGAIAVHGSTGSLTIQSNLFNANDASDKGGAIAGVIDSAPLLIRDNRFQANHADLAGAALFLDDVHDVTVDHNYFTGQTGQWGMIYVGESGLVFTRNTLIDNNTGRGLEILYSAPYNPQVVNNLFVRTGVPAIRILGSGDPTGSYVLTVNFKHNTLVGSGSSASTAVEVSSINCNVTDCAHATFDNTIVYHFGTGFDVLVKGYVSLDYIMFCQVTVDKYTGYTIIYNEILSGYAGFVDYLQDDYHLTANAPARDKGKNAGVTIDIDGDKRPIGAGYDLGADEFAYHVLFPIMKK